MKNKHLLRKLLIYNNFTQQSMNSTKKILFFYEDDFGMHFYNFVAYNDLSVNKVTFKLSKISNIKNYLFYKDKELKILKILQ